MYINRVAIVIPFLKFLFLFLSLGGGQQVCNAIVFFQGANNNFLRLQKGKHRNNNVVIAMYYTKKNNTHTQNENLNITRT